MNIFRSVQEENGVTLTELLVTMSVAAILVVALGFSFQGWMGNYKVESEVKQLYADIMDARTRAMTQNRMHFVQISTNNYTVYEDTNDNYCINVGTGDDLLKTTPLQYTMGWTGTLGFDTKGLAWHYSTPPCTRVSNEIALPLTPPSGTHPDFDCIDVFQSRVSMGTMSGSNCIYR